MTQDSTKEARWEASLLKNWNQALLVIKRHHPNYPSVPIRDVTGAHEAFFWVRHTRMTVDGASGGSWSKYEKMRRQPTVNELVEVLAPGLLSLAERGKPEQQSLEL